MGRILAPVGDQVTMLSSKASKLRNPFQEPPRTLADEPFRVMRAGTEKRND